MQHQKKEDMSNLTVHKKNLIDKPDNKVCHARVQSKLRITISQYLVPDDGAAHACLCVWEKER